MSLAVLRDRRFLFTAALLLCVYAATLVISPKRVFWTPDEGAKWLEMHSVRLQGDLRYVIDFPAQRVDREFHYLPHAGIFPRPSTGPDGDLYIGFETPVVFPLLSGIGWRLFGVAGVYLIPLVSGWLLAVIAGVLAAAVRPGAAVPATLVVGLATPVWFYSTLFWEHTLASCLAMLALAIVAVAPPWSLTGLLGALLALLAAAVFRLEILAFALSLVVAWGLSGLIMRRANAGRGALRISPLAAAGSLVLLAAGAGAFFFLRASLTVRHNRLVEELPVRLQRGIETMVQSPWSILDVFVHTSISEAPPASDAWVLTAAAGMLLCLAAAFVRRVRWESVLLLPGLVLVLAFSVSLLTEGETYRALHGFVPIAPFMIVAPYAWTESRREGRSYVLVLMATLAAAGCVISMLAISTIYLEVGRLAVGLEWGQRYLLTFYAVVAVLAVVAVQLYWRSPRPLWLRRAFAGAVALMVLAAVGFQIRGNTMLYRTRVRLSVWDTVMQPEAPIVTDVWWLPASFAVLYTEKEMYYVHPRSAVAGWMTRAAPRGVERFTFVSFEPVDAADLGIEDVGADMSQTNNVHGLYMTRFVLKDPAERAAQPSD